MTIYFNVKEAREYLLKNGFVYTLRQERSTGKEQVRKSLNKGVLPFELLGFADVSFVKEIENLYDLKDYVTKSGFRTIDDWIVEAKDSRFLYKVEMEK